MKKRLLMISGDRALARGDRGAFFYTLQELRQYFEHVDVICPRVNDVLEARPFENVSVFASPYPLWMQSLWIIRKGRQLIGAFHHDTMTVHEYPPFYNGIGAAFLHLLTKIPYLLEIHHIPGYPRAANFKERIYLLLTKMCVALDAVFASGVRVVNKKEAPEFLARHGIPRNKMRFCPSFYIDFNIFHPYDDVSKKYDLVYCARLEHNKGIMNLIQAVEIVKKIKPDISLMLIGKGSLSRSLKQYVVEHGLEKNVIFSGWLADSESVARTYCSARFFVNPSFNEGGPRVLLEAMACGLSVITTRVGIAHDIIREGENGWFCGWSPRELAVAIEKAIAAHINIKPFYQEDFSYKNAIRAYAELLSRTMK